MSNWGARLALLVAVVSVWIAFQIGFDEGRRLVASVFLVGIPASVAVLFLWFRWKTARAARVFGAAPEFTQQIEMLSARLTIIERKLDDVLNRLSPLKASVNVQGTPHDDS